MRVSTYLMTPGRTRDESIKVTKFAKYILTQK